MSKLQSEQIAAALTALDVRKKWQINHNGLKIKVVRQAVEQYAIYRDGHHVTTDATPQEALTMVLALLENKS